MKKMSFVLVLILSAFGIAGVSDGLFAQESEPAKTEAVAAKTPASMPKMIDFGSKQCKACKAMEPVLESLMNNHADKFITEFVDVWQPENQPFAKLHAIKSIPTQIFFAADGKELFRQTGFITEEGILAKWSELGYDFADTDSHSKKSESVKDFEASSQSTAGAE
jgi:thioredoxin 1